MSDNQEPAHSPLGASSAKRWMNCPGSISLFHAVTKEEDESEYAAEGTIAHKIAELCLKNGYSTEDFLLPRLGVGVPKDFEFAAVQSYVDFCRSKITKDTEVFIEYHVGAEEALRPHPDFYGTLDFGAHDPNTKLVLVDLKFGAGISVSAWENPQQMYYAFGFVLEHPDIPDDFPVEINIFQPRIGWEDPVRTYDTTAGALREWGYEVLLPAMGDAASIPDLKAGEWCRFCPRRIQCPLLQGMFKVAATIGVGNVPKLQDAALGQEWAQIDAVKMYIKAVESEAYKRLSTGREIEGLKLVDQRSRRVWKDGAVEIMELTLGDEAFNPCELRSPAELEKLGGVAKDVTKEWAYFPKTGYTVAASSDPKPAVKVETPEDTFSHLLNG